MTKLEDGSVLYAVYGTLRKGCGNDHCIQGAEYLGTIKTEPKYTLHNLGFYPGVSEDGETAVVVEVYKTNNPRIIERVNGLEGYNGVRNSPDNHFYDTCGIETPWGEGNMFIMNKLKSITHDIIESGDWKKRR